MSYRGRGPGRFRNMYNLTGLPGFIRFGYSPGWRDRSPTGLGPCAQYLYEKGLLNEFIDKQANRGFYFTPSKEQRIEFLKTQKDYLQKTIKNLEDELKKLQSEE